MTFKLSSKIFNNNEYNYSEPRMSRLAVVLQNVKFTNKNV